MNKTQGTPRTLAEAIHNGFSPTHQVAHLELHIRDYLAQKFGIYTMSQDEKVVEAVTALWESIFKEKDHE